MVEALKIPAHQPTSVGAMLKEEFLDPMGISQGQLAKAMNVGRKTVNELCGNRRGVTAESAFLLAKVLGTTPEFWLNLQLLNDMWLAKHNEVLAEKVAKAQTYHKVLAKKATKANPFGKLTGKKTEKTHSKQAA